MNRQITISTTFLFLIALSSCDSGSHKAVVQEQEKSQKEINAAQNKVVDQKEESQRTIDKARLKGDLGDIEDAKIDATKDIAEAELNVDEKKIEGTEAISDAKRAAGETSGTYQRK